MTAPAGPPASTPEDALAAWVADLERGDIPAPVADRVRLLLLDAVASAVAGRTTAEVPAMEAAARAFGGDGETSVIGGAALAPAGAVLLNGYEVTAATICDVHRPILCHVTPVVVPPALAIAERLERSGAELLTALAAGMEVAIRVGLAMDYPHFRARGWHSPGVVGPFGGAAAAARLLDLDALATRHALALAGSQAAGTFAGLGSAQVKFHQARGAVSGLLAAIVAAEGIDGGARILGNPDGGLFATYADGGAPDRLLDELGERWELLDVSLRRWPAASALQPVVQACLELVAHGPLDEAARVEVALPATAYQMHGQTDWHDQLSAFQSARYVGAVVLRDGRCWLDQFSETARGDSALSHFATDRVSVSIDDSLPSGGAAVSIKDAAAKGRVGETRAVRVEIPLGDPRAMLDADAIAGKLRDAATGTPLAERADRLVELIVGLDRLPSVRTLTTALRA